MFATLALLLPLGGQSAGQSPDQALVEVKPGPKRYFHDTDQSGTGASAKPSRAYVMPGDRLVAGEARSGFTSVTFVNAKGRVTRGWIESATLARVAVPGASVAGWTGKWTSDDADIEISLRGGRLHLEGDAVWGTHDPQRVAMGGIHTGEFAADVPPRGDRLAFSVVSGDAGETAQAYDAAPEDEFRCRVKLRLLGPYMIAQDNLQCGGMNVTFAGIYRRVAR